MENTNTFTITKEQYHTIIAAWAAKKEHTAAEHIIYNVLRGKSVTLGFKEKSVNIQGNDPWFGFNTALFNAQQKVSIAKDREYVEKYSNDPTKEQWVRYTKQGIEERTKAFETTFGVPLTDELYDFIKTVKKVK